MRILLGIDTASRFGSIALARDGKAEAWSVLLPGGHSSGLSVSAARLLGDRGLGLADLAGVAVASGPGSFTGLRIGLAWAKGVCSATETPMALVSSHEASAHARRHASPFLATVLPGERGEAQVALWSGGERVSLLFGPERVAEAALAEVIGRAMGDRGRTMPTGLGADAVRVVTGDLSPSTLEALMDAGFPAAESWNGAEAGGPEPPPLGAAVAELGDRELLAGNRADVASAAPSYGRAPNARRPGP